MKIDGRTLIVEEIVDAETVEVDPDNIESFANWSPSVEKRFSTLAEAQRERYRKFSSEPEAVFETWRKETLRVASRCINPRAALGQELSTRQLVVGRVQSGKTTNFTGVMALLADNGYRFFIVIGGTTLPLFQQTKNRLREDLGERWFQFFSTSDEHSTWEQTSSQIKHLLSDLARHEDNPNVLRPKKAICLTVLKWNVKHLDSVRALLRDLQKDTLTGDFMRRLPIAVIDDECDTFTPNSNIRNPDKDATAIYTAVLGVVEAIPVSTYLGYTATPMANELQALDDALRPEKVTVLEPGPDYLGPEHLFGTGSRYPNLIFDWDGSSPLPDSLKEAVGAFIAHSVVFHHEDPEVRSRYLEKPALDHSVDSPTSMLVHVAREIRITEATFNALENLRSDWKDQLSARPSPAGILDSQTEALLERYLVPPLAKLGAENLIPKQELVQLAGEALRDVGIKLILGSNNESAVEFPPESELKRHQLWIFVGAQLLDRGQTLPNLLITYLARNSGGGAKGREAGGNVDTLLQRGRFFGYRLQYRKLLGGYFSETSFESLKATAGFETAMRESLRFVDNNNLPFGLVEAIYELDPSTPKMIPTRKSVTPLSMKTTTLDAQSWILQRHVYGVEESPKNSTLLRSSLESWVTDIGLIESSEDLNLSLKAQTAIDFFSNWHPHPIDAEQFNVVRKILEHGYRTKKFDKINFTLRKTKDSQDGLWERTSAAEQTNFYKNKQSNQSPRDREMRMLGTPTFQVKVFKIVHETTGEILLSPVPSISVNLGADVRYLMGAER